MNNLKLFVLFAVLSLGIAAPMVAASHGVLTGNIVSQTITYGTGGMINRIDLGFDTGDGITWTLTCRRANANLGMCSNPTMDTYEAAGTFSAHGVLELETFVQQ